MAQETKPLPYKEFVEHIDEHLAALEAPGSELAFEKNGHVFHVHGEAFKKRDIWANYSAKRAMEVFDRRAGNVMKGLDTEAFLRELRESRGQDSPGRPA